MNKELQYNLTGEIKTRVLSVLSKIKYDEDEHVSNAIWTKFYHEIDSNWADERFHFDELYKAVKEHYIVYAVEKLRSDRIERVRFWSDVCKETAKHSSQPHIIANEALEAKMKAFESVTESIFDELI